MTTKQTRGFTLVELLVVIGIIALLISILLPALEKGKQAANQAACLSQLRQFHQGSHLYKTDHKDKFTGAGWRATLYLYLKNPRVFICPSDDRPFRSLDSGLIDIVEAPYDIALEEGPMVRKKGTDDNYTLNIDDAPDPTQGDQDYNDLVVRIEDQFNGFIKLTVVGIDAGYHFDLIDARDRKVLLPDLGRKTKAGTSIMLPAGYASYAFNSETNKVYGISGKILALDYGRSVANPAVDSWKLFRGKMLVPPFARHSRMVNVLWSDGGASLTPLSQIDPATATNVKKYWKK